MSDYLQPGMGGDAGMAARQYAEAFGADAARARLQEAE
jgi:hypothetical protein